MIIVDSIVLYAMLMKTLAIQKEANKAQIRSLVIDTLIRDGTIYFLAVLATSLAHLLVFQATEQVYLKAFICSLSAILVSRFFLNLREAAAGGREIEEL
ncbi:hypothetical protein PsYK624_071390 [Phanerochaete sordida]|uniref:Uncharacterized protein n=1 Tax=Phanerochaete sordida TaxID=48140 RepID=A0A9P3GAE0_9APHY|nr:hypothetical protein PsYK624_071390 [Phanerochaete sordida]